MPRFSQPLPRLTISIWFQNDFTLALKKQESHKNQFHLLKKYFSVITIDYINLREIRFFFFRFSSGYPYTQPHCLSSPRLTFCFRFVTLLFLTLFFSPLPSNLLERTTFFTSTFWLYCPQINRRASWLYCFDTRHRCSRRFFRVKTVSYPW